MTYALIVAGIAAVVGVASSVAQGRNQKAIAEYNAEQQENAAQQERINAGIREEDTRREARRMIGAQAAAQAESGTQLNGSASDLFRQSLFNAEMDAQTVRYGGEADARSRLNAATGERFSGKLAKNSAGWSAAASLASSASSAYGSYKKGA